MKHIAFATAFVVTLLPLSLSAQEETDKGESLMEQGARLFFQGLMEEMEPALKELEGMADQVEPGLRSFAENMGPALRDLLTEVEDWSAYHTPEVLPNGDIIIRRKTPQEELPQDRKDPPEEIDL